MDELNCQVKNRLMKDASFEQMKEYNYHLYEDILTGQYDKSYANPAYAKEKLGEELGGLLCFLYTELRAMIIYAVEQRLFDMTILTELFVEILCLFEDGIPTAKEVKEIIYYFESDYADHTIGRRRRLIRNYLLRRILS